MTDKPIRVGFIGLHPGMRVAVALSEMNGVVKRFASGKKPQ